MMRKLIISLIGFICLTLVPYEIGSYFSPPNSWEASIYATGLVMMIPIGLLLFGIFHGFMVWLKWLTK